MLNRAPKASPVPMVYVLDSNDAFVQIAPTRLSSSNISLEEKEEVYEKSLAHGRSLSPNITAGREERRKWRPSIVLLI